MLPVFMKMYKGPNIHPQIKVLIPPPSQTQNDQIKNNIVQSFWFQQLLQIYREDPELAKVVVSYISQWMCGAIAVRQTIEQLILQQALEQYNDKIADKCFQRQTQISRTEVLHIIARVIVKGIKVMPFVKAICLIDDISILDQSPSSRGLRNEVTQSPSSRGLRNEVTQSPSSRGLRNEVTQSPSSRGLRDDYDAIKALFFCSQQKVTVTGIKGKWLDKLEAQQSGNEMNEMYNVPMGIIEHMRSIVETQAKTLKSDQRIVRYVNTIFVALVRQILKEGWESNYRTFREGNFRHQRQIYHYRKQCIEQISEIIKIDEGENKKVSEQMEVCVNELKRRREDYTMLQDNY